MTLLARIRACSLLTGMFLSLLLHGNTSAEEAAPPEPRDTTSTHTTPDVVVQPKLDLGLLEIKNHEPTRNQTSKVTFGMYLTLSADTPPELLAELEHWQHRLRDQVIIAIRVAELSDFLDPELVRLRRHILFRVNRILPGTQADDVLLSDFMFSTE